MIKFIFAVFLLLSSNTYAAMYFELGLESGGDTIIGSTIGENISAGSGVKFAGGIQNQIGVNGELLSLSLGYLFDNINAFNGSAEISTLTFDAIYSFQRDRHRFGVGGSYHIGPTYEDNIFPAWKINFDDSLGLILQYSYSMYNGLQIGARLTNMDYKVRSSNAVPVGLTLDAGSFGIFLSNGF